MNPAETYILKQTEPYKSILIQLQTIVEAVAPNAQLLYKWRVPYYYFNGIPLCFLNQSKDYVDLGFWHYDKMGKFVEHFVISNRKFMRSLRYKSIADINEEVIIYVIQKQLEVNCNPYKMVRKK